MAKHKINHGVLSIVFSSLFAGVTRSMRAFSAAKRRSSPGGVEVTPEELRDILVSGLTKAAVVVKTKTGIDLVPVFASFSDSAEVLATLKAEFAASKKQAKLAESKAKAALADALAEVERVKATAVALTKPAVDAVIDAAKGAAAVVGELPAPKPSRKSRARKKKATQ